MTVRPLPPLLTSPFAHQAQEYEQHAEDPTRAKWWEMGTGKTWDALATTYHLFLQGAIGAAVVVAPSGVERNWVNDELPAHVGLDSPFEPFVFKSESSGTKRHAAALARFLETPPNRLPFLAISFDAWMTDRGKQAVWDLMRTRPTILHVDEAANAKTPNSKRSKSIIRGAPYARYRRIMTGTPVDNSPFDVYSQVRILDEGYWRRELGLPTFQTFKSFFGVWDKGYNRATGEDFPVLHSYQNIPILRAHLLKLGSRILLDDCVDLPPKVYTRRYYEMAPRQRALYEALEEEFHAFWPDDPEQLITAPLTIVRMLRLQQVLCGYVPVDGDEEPRAVIDPSDNPRLNALTGFVEDASAGNAAEPLVIWTVYRLDADLIMDRMARLGRKVVRYDGAVSDDDCERAKLAFRAGEADTLVINQMKGAEGLTLTNSHISAIYSNAYRYLKRRQLEARTRRLGQSKACVYADFVCEGTRDASAISILQKKGRTAAETLGDRPEENWIEDPK